MKGFGSILVGALIATVAVWVLGKAFPGVKRWIEGVVPTVVA